MCVRLILRLGLFVFTIKWVSSYLCSRVPTTTLVGKSPVDENFAIVINNNPETYVLGQAYDISINAYNGHRYTTFILALEDDSGRPKESNYVGYFEISDPIATRHRPHCDGMVESRNTNPKTRASVTWIAPTEPGSGCVLIRATIFQHPHVWHMDDGALTRRICEEKVDAAESQRTPDGQECCACDEASYELTFQGIWNRNLHPKNFPPNSWKARFGDIIGAAHTTNYSFWREGELASDAMKEYAERGFSSQLEREFNNCLSNDTIRTIIKARGPGFPNLNGFTVASVRVNPQNHLISLASKVEPSPDWFVGISGLDLCMLHCTWLDERVIDLYPWDAGTDAGPSYTSEDEAQVPPDVIQRIDVESTKDPRSPFYDEDHGEMAPFARLTIKRKRIYERACQDEDSNNNNKPYECYTHPWTGWSECSAQCGDGYQYRTRIYKQPELARIYNCDAIINNRDERRCQGEKCNGPEAEIANRYGINLYAEEHSQAVCELSEWEPWSECSKTCGLGIQTRRRQYKNSRIECQREGSEALVEYQQCKGEKCLGDLRNREAENNEYANNAFNPYNNNNNENRETGNFNSYGNNVDNYNINEYNKPQRYDVEEQPEQMEQNKNDFEVGNLNTNNLGRNSYRQGSQTFWERQNRPSYDPPVTATEHIVQPTDNCTNSQLPENESELIIPTACFETLRSFNCLDSTVTQHFWFYNYCEDKCMLYITDSCDRNQNKFISVEKCEETCRRSEYEMHLKRQQEENCQQFERQQRKNRRKQFNNNWRQS